MPDQENKYGDDRTLLGNDDLERWPKPKPRPKLICIDGERVRGEVLEFRIVEDDFAEVKP
jgi:hypothetical protein